MPSLLLGGAGPTGAGGAAFSPSDVAGLELWLKADALALSDGTAVATWTDSSGLGNNATQVTGSLQPLFKTAIVNSLPVLRFDGTDDFMTVAAITNNDATRTIFCVAKQAADTASRRVWAFSATNASLTNVSSQWTYFANQAVGATSFGTAPAAGFAVVAVRFNTTSSADGFVSTGGATNFDPHDDYQVTGSALIVGALASANQPWNGDIAEVISYNSALSETDRGNVRDYLRTKYAL